MAGEWMITRGQNTAWGFRVVNRILLLFIIHATYAVSAELRPVKVNVAEGYNTRPVHLTRKAGLREDREGRTQPPIRHFQNGPAQAGHTRVTDLRFTHLTTNDGLSQSYVNAILQDRRGFMWFGTRDGLNRYDGNDFVVYKHSPSDAGSLAANFIEDLKEDDQGYLWVATLSGGVDKFDPTTEQFAHYRHDPKNPNSIGSDWVERIACDSRGYLWFGTGDSGLDRFEPATSAFTHYSKDSDGRFVGEITDVIADRHGDIWFVGERGLFHLNSDTGQITRPSAATGLAADYVYEDSAGDLWILAYSPAVALVKYDPQAERVTKYPLGADAVGVAGSSLLADGQNGFWVPSSHGLYYFDRRTERFTHNFRHSETSPDGLNDNTVVSVYQDRGGLLWVGTENGGLNLLNFRQEQFGAQWHRPGDPNSLSPGEITAIYEEPGGVLWVGFYPRALDRFDRQTGRVAHYVPGPENRNGLGKGRDVNGIYQDPRGYLWLSGWEAGLDRFDERTGEFKHYRHNPHDPSSLMSNYIFTIYGDLSGQIWVEQNDGISRFDPVTEQFTHYRSEAKDATSYGNWALSAYQDRSGTLWFGRGGGMLSRFDDKTNTFVNDRPDSRDPSRLQGGNIVAIHEDRAGTLWLGGMDGLYRLDRQGQRFARYSQGLPSSAIQCILEDKAGRLWLSSKKGISRFDPQTGIFRNYDVSDGLQSNDFGKACYQGADGEMFFGGSNGLNAFFPERIRDDPYLPPVVITRFKIFNKPVPIGAKSVLTRAISYVDSLTLPYADSVFSLEFAALSYANPQNNRYRYKLEGLEPAWNEVGSRQRLATYTNLDPGKYTFRVQGANGDGVWNEAGLSLAIVVTSPWWKTSWFRALCAALFLALVWSAHRLRVHEFRRESKQLRDVIDTIPGYVWSALPDGSVDFINRRWLEFSGISLEQALGRGWEAAVHPDDLARFVDAWRTAVACGKAMESEARLRGADGRYRWLLIRNVPLRDRLGKILKWYGTSTDIDDRRRAEEALRRSEAYLTEAQRLSHTGSWALDLASDKYVYVSEEDFRIWGFDPQQGLPTREEVFRRIHPEDRTRWQENFERALREKAEGFDEYRIMLPDGTLKHIHTIRHPVLNDAGDVVRLLGTSVDITERKRAEEALRRSEAYLAEAQRLSHTGSWARSPATGETVYWSEEMFRIFGLNPQEGLPTGEAFWKRIHPEDLDRTYELSQNAARATSDYDYEHRIVLPDGTVKHIHTVGHPVFGENGQVSEYVGTSMDVTEQRRAEKERERLRQLEADLAHLNRVSIMGELAASIAHEVNQPLSGVVSNGSACLRWLAGDAPNLEEARETARRIVRDGKRAADVVARIRALTKKAVTSQEKLDLNETIQDVLALIGDEAKRNRVIIQTQLTDDLAPVSGDRVELQQLVLNLVMNAIEAMSSVDERARELVIKTRNVDPDQVQATVKDSGPGIDPRMIDKIFDPFYTTKPGGMGMGLSISRSILQAHGGRLWAAAKDGPGTIFHFSLPKYHEVEKHAGAAAV